MIVSRTFVTVALLTVALIAVCISVICIIRRKRIRKQRLCEANREIDEILKTPGVEVARIRDEETCQPVADGPTLDVESVCINKHATVSDDAPVAELEEEVETDINEIIDTTDDCETISKSEYSTLFDEEKLRLITASVTDDDLKGLMEDRVAEFTEDSRHRDDCALSAVDFLDELTSIESVYEEAISTLIANMKDVIKEGLQKSDYEILNSDVWNPDIQRAVKISHVLEPDTLPQIVSKRATGLRWKERLIRKQEVEILKH